VEDLSEGFRYHDLRHYFASLLIASGADVKAVQAPLRHASAKTALDTYGHRWPDRDESTRAGMAIRRSRARTFTSVTVVAGQGFQYAACLLKHSVEHR
jgi:integrase